MMVENVYTISFNGPVITTLAVGDIVVKRIGERGFGVGDNS